MSREAGIGLALSVWAVVAYFWWDAHVLRWYLKHGRNEPRRTMWLALVTHVGALLVASGLWLGFRDTTDSLRNVVAYAVAATYGPFSALFVPRQTGFGTHREQFEDIGATPAVARALFWSAFLPALGGFLCTCISVFEALDRV